MAKNFILINRLFLGIIFLIAGINGYFVILGFEPFIATSPEAMALFEFKYLLVAEKTLEILCGISLLANQFIPLTLVLLSPIIANILLLHLFLDPSLLFLAIILFVSYSCLLYSYRKNYTGIVDRKPDPS